MISAYQAKILVLLGYLYYCFVVLPPFSFFNNNTVQQKYANTQGLSDESCGGVYPPIIMCVKIDFAIMAIVARLITYQGAYGWKFDTLGLDEEKIALSKIMLYGRRAFVAIPRVDENQTTTLVEVPWPEYSELLTMRPFPDSDSQNVGDCRKLQSAVTMDCDTKGRLYILDGGMKNVCPPKIVVYDLKINKKLLHKELRSVPNENLSSLVVDVNPSSGDVKVIVGDAGHTSLLVYNFKEQVWWKLVLNKNFEMNEDFIRGDDDFIKVDGKWSFSLNQLAASKRSSILYATSSKSVELFSVNLSELRRLGDPKKLYCNWYDYNGTEISFRYVGNKFGKSKALYVNNKDDLYYFYEKDYAILRWNINSAFAEENMEVVVQDYALIPRVTQIFSDRLHLWALNSKRNENLSYTVRKHCNRSHRRNMKTKEYQLEKK